MNQHILIVNYEYPPIGAGAANASYFLAKELLSFASSVSVITSAFENCVGIDIEDGVNVIRVKSKRKKRESASIWEMLSFVWNALKFLIGNEKPYTHTIVFFSIPCGPIGLYLKWFRDIPYTLSLRGGDVPGTEKDLTFIYWLLTPFRRIILRNSKHIIANSDGLKNMAMEADPYPVKVIPNGIDTIVFSPIVHSNVFFTFLFVGRLNKQKNLFFLIDGFCSLIKKINKNIKLLIVGDGPLKCKLENYIINSGYSNQIKMLGWKNKKDLTKIYQTSDCFVNPSYYEGMPNTVIEALASGIPAIVSKVPGNYEISVAVNSSCFLIDLEDKEQLTNVMEDVYINRVLHKSRKFVLNQKIASLYSWNATAKSYFELME